MTQADPSDSAAQAGGDTPVERRLASLLAIAADAIILFDREQRILLFNEGAERIFGWEAEEVVHRPIDILLPERFHDVLRRHVADFAASPIPARRMGERQEIFGLRKSGEEFPAEASIAKSGSGPETTYTVVLRDVTERRAVEQELSHRERQLRETQAIAHLGSWEWDVDRDLVTWSDEMYRIYGLEPGSVEITFEGFLSRVHPDDREKARAKVVLAYEKQRSFSFMHRIVRPDGSIRTLHARGEVVRDAEGRVVRMVGTGQDVTARLETERKARRLAAERAARAEAESTARRMEFLAEAGRILGGSLDYRATLKELTRLAVPFLAEYCAVFLADEEGLTLQRVASAHSRPDLEERIVRIEKIYVPELDNPHSLVGQVFHSAEPRLFPKLSPEILNRAVARPAEALELTGQLAPRSAILLPLVSRNRRLGVIAFFRSADASAYSENDLAVAKRLAAKAALALDNARLYESERRARSQAERAAALRDEVLAVVSHDLRSPLNAIALSAEMLGHELPREKERHLVTIRRSVEHMTRLVEDLLDVGRIETGRFAVRRESTDPREAVERALERFRPAAGEKGLDLVQRPGEPLSDVPLDRRRVEQVLSNLLENAIRHTPAGGRIEVSVAAEPGETLFSVVDTGEGIPEARQRELFAPVWQAREGGRRRGGLGLTIARGIVEAHGGRIWVDSQPGQGSAFHFTIPTEAADGERGNPGRDRRTGSG